MLLGGKFLDGRLYNMFSSFDTRLQRTIPLSLLPILGQLHGRQQAESRSLYSCSCVDCSPILAMSGQFTSHKDSELPCFAEAGLVWLVSISPTRMMWLQHCEKCAVCAFGVSARTNP